MTIELAKNPPPSVRREEHMIQRDLIIVVEGHNFRFDFGDIEALGEQIYSQFLIDGVGVLQALTLKRSLAFAGKYELVSGERRIRAVDYVMKKYGVDFAKGLPAKLLDKNTTASDAQLRDLLNNVSAKPLLPLEEAAAYQSFLSAGMSIEKLSKAIGKNHAQIWAAVQLLKADPTVIDAVKDGTINSTMAKDIATRAKGDAAAQKEAVKIMRDAKGKGSKAVNAAKKQAKAKVDESQEKRVTAKGKALKMRALSDEQLNALGTKVSADLVKLLKDANYPSNEKLLEDCGNDHLLAACFTLGALQALKAAAGMKINLKL